MMRSVSNLVSARCWRGPALCSAKPPTSGVVTAVPAFPAARVVPQATIYTSAQPSISHTAVSRTPFLLAHSCTRTVPSHVTVNFSSAADIDRFAKDVKAEELSKDSTAVDYTLPHPIWQGEYVDSVEQTHQKPEKIVDRLAYYTVKTMRFNFDWMSGYSWKPLTEEIWLKRIMFLETVAGVPGSVAGILRHLKSLRRMQRDHGWIHTLFEEAENERMHLLTALQLLKPGLPFRAAVWVTQGIFFNFFFFSYLISPRFCHSFVGYLEEEAVRTYTHCLSEIDKGNLPWKDTPAPPVAKKYWKMPDDASMRDVIMVIRADEAHHRDANHTFAHLKPDEDNPIPPGQ